MRRYDPVVEHHYDQSYLLNFLPFLQPYQAPRGLAFHPFPQEHLLQLFWLIVVGDHKFSSRSDPYRKNMKALANSQQHLYYPDIYQ